MDPDEAAKRVRVDRQGGAALGDSFRARDSDLAKLEALICQCSHSRGLHRYEKDRKAWTVCLACRCVRFTVQGAGKGKR